MAKSKQKKRRSGRALQIPSGSGLLSAAAEILRRAAARSDIGYVEISVDEPSFREPGTTAEIMVYGSGLYKAPTYPLGETVDTRVVWEVDSDGQVHEDDIVEELQARLARDED